MIEKCKPLLFKTQHLVFVFLLTMQCVAAQNPESTPPSPYSRYLQCAVPSGGVQIDLNPTTLRWPYEKGKNISYDVRLAQDSTFRSGTIIQQKATPWAMFNPHQKLQAGTWYWQYRKSQGSWSNLYSFQVKQDAVAVVSPTSEDFLSKIPKSHPRLLASKPEIIELRKRKKDADIIQIIKEADAALLQRIPAESEGIATDLIDDELKNKQLVKLASMGLSNQIYDMVYPLSQAFALTGDNRYAQKAIAIGRVVAQWDPKKVTVLSDFGDARCMLSLALIYDTFYDQLADSDKIAFRKGAAIRIKFFYEEWKNNIEVRVLSAHVWQHILHYYFQSAIAIFHDEPNASTWLGYGYELFLARTPILSGNEGGWVNGASYFRMNMETCLDIAMLIKKYTDYDHVNAHPWYKNHIDWLLYGMPPGSNSDGFGDNYERISSPGIEYVAFAMEMAKITQSSKAAWYAATCREYETIDLSQKSILRWFRLTKTNGLPMPAIKKEALPLGQLFQETGVVAMHTHPMDTKNDLMVAMRSSPFGSYGHMMADQNTFNILSKGEKTFYRSGYKVDMNDPHRLGWYKHTKGNNGILMDGQGQPFSTDAFGMLTRFVQNDQLAYVKGDASFAYQSEETKENYGLKKFNRHIVLLQPNTLVIYDELEAEKPVKWSWLIHSHQKIEMDSVNQTFTSQFEKSFGKATLWSSSPVNWNLTGSFEIAAVNVIHRKDEDGDVMEFHDNQWHFKAENPEKTNKIRFLSIIQFSETAKKTAPLKSTDSAGKKEIAFGKWRISATMDPNTFGQLTITNTDNTTEFHATTQSENGPTVLKSQKNGKLQIVEQLDQLPTSMKNLLLYEK